MNIDTWLNNYFENYLKEYNTSKEVEEVIIKK